MRVILLGGFFSVWDIFFTLYIYGTTIIKIWTESLSDFTSSKKIEILIELIAEKIQQWVHILLVTSWAVQYGRIVLWRQKLPDENTALLAALGWDTLIWLYRQRFLSLGIHTAGFLLTHADIEDYPERRWILKETINEAWKQWMVVIVNEHDALSIAKIDRSKRGEDNDRNALMLSQVFGAMELYLITNTNGVYRDYRDSSTRIATIDHLDMTDIYIDELCWTQSTTWTGWMRSKLMVAREASESWISTHIGNGIDSGIHDTQSWGTTILAKQISHT